jgi:hypothetical protein
MKRVVSSLLVAFALFAVPLLAFQGGSVGTLPHHNQPYQRISALLDPWSTLTFQQGQAQFVVISSHNGEDNIAGSGGAQDTSTIHAHWRSKHMDLTIDCPRLESDGPGQEGDIVQAARLARMVSSLQTYFPPDGT